MPLIGETAETKFFEFLFGRQIVERLAQHYPSPRERHHVPLWVYLSSQLSLRLHGQHSFHSYPLIIRAGGLIDALGPEVARREIDPQSGDVKLDCKGFNDRHQHPGKTPCDQDFLRKLARDTKPDELEDWYNRHAAAMYQELGAFDSDGCLSRTAPIHSYRIIRVMKALSDCCSMSTTIPSARNKSKK